MIKIDYLADTIQMSLGLLIKDFGFVVRTTNKLLQCVLKIFDDIFYC
jgi:hypothetical protein